mgnify:CR=1 FL=1
MGFLKEFKEFALKGNVVDMAVGVIIGGAFGKIVTSVVEDIIMPPIGALLGGSKFSELKWTIQEAVAETADSPAKDAVSINYGSFLQTVIDFLIVALCIFFAIKAINKLKRKKEEEPAAPAEPSNEEKLLGEIRDLLKEKK